MSFTKDEKMRALPKVDGTAGSAFHSSLSDWQQGHLPQPKEVVMKQSFNTSKLYYGPIFILGVSGPEL